MGGAPSNAPQRSMVFTDDPASCAISAAQAVEVHHRQLDHHRPVGLAFDRDVRADLAAQLRDVDRIILTGCGTCNIQIANGVKRPVVHTMEILRRAYGV